MGRKLLDKYLLSEGDQLHGQEDSPGIVVTLGRDLSTDQTVLVKAFGAAFLDRKGGVREALDWETAILSATNHHPNVVKLLDVFNTPNEIFAVTETMSGGGDLFDAIVAAGRLEDDLARHFFGQMLDGIEHCHSRGVCHRDIKPENVLLDPTGNVKLAGFPLAWMYDSSTGDDLVQLSHSTTCGTLEYTAPEVIQAVGYAGTAGNTSYAGRPADLWSLGVTLYTMLAGYLPFEAESEDAVADKVQAGDFKVDPGMTASARALLDRLLELDPKKRFTVDQVRSHPWFQRDQRDEARRMECQLIFAARRRRQQHQHQHQQQQPAAGTTSAGPGHGHGHGPDFGAEVGKGRLFESGSQPDGPGGVFSHGDGEDKGKASATLAEQHPGDAGAVVPSRGRVQTAQALPPPPSPPLALPPALRQLLPKLRQVAVVDVDDSFTGSAEAAAFLYGDDSNDHASGGGRTGGDAFPARPPSPPSGFNTPITGLESLAGADPPRPRRRQSEGSVFGSMRSFGTPISGFTPHFGARGAGGSGYSVPDDERSLRLDTFSSYAISEEDRGRLWTSSTTNGELHGGEDEEGEERARRAMGSRRSFPGASRISVKPHPWRRFLLP